MTKSNNVAVYIQENLPNSINYPDCRPVVLLREMGWDVHVVTLRLNMNWEVQRICAEPNKAAVVGRVARIHPDFLFSEGGAWQLAAVPFAKFSWVRTPARSPSTPKRLVHDMLLRHADIVSVCNPWEKRRWHIAAEKLIDLPYPVDVGFWSSSVDRDPGFWSRHGMPEPSGPVVVSVGQIMRRKRQVELLQWLTPVLQDRPNLTLVLAGWVLEPAEMQQLETLISRNELQAQVHVPGSLTPRSELRQLLAWSDAQVLNTTWESQCMALYEALAAGVPTLIPALPELSSAFPHLPSHKDERELRLNLERLLDDPALGRTLVEQSENRLRWADIPEHDRIFKDAVDRLAGSLS